MGIPVYFKTLVSEYQDTILHKNKINDINFLFLDLNCLIHPCCRGLTDEDEMITKIIYLTLNQFGELIIFYELY